jgi:hypothetical protein
VRFTIPEASLPLWPFRPLEDVRSPTGEFDKGVMERNVDEGEDECGGCSTVQENSIYYNTVQSNATQHTTQYNTTQHNTTQFNTTQRNTTQHNTEVDVSGAQYCSFITAEPYGFSTYLVRATAVPPHRRWTWGAEPRLGLKEGVAV